MFDADVWWTSKKFITRSSKQDVNATNELADETFMESVSLVPVNQEVFWRGTQLIKPTQYQISL